MSYEELEQGYINKEYHPADLKEALRDELNRVLDKVRADFDNAEMQALKEAAYPTVKQDAGPKLTKEEQWIRDEFLKNNEYPTFKEIRAQLNVSKGKAKQFLKNV